MVAPQTYAWKAWLFICRRVRGVFSTFATRALFWFNGVKPNGLRAMGVPFVNVSRGGVVRIGDGFVIRTGLRNTEVGSVGSRIWVGPGGSLVLGARVGMSNCTIAAYESVEIGDDVLIGGGVQIFDTNFHSTDAASRASGRAGGDKDVRRAPVKIGNRVFIGTNAIVCKGVTIGDGAIVAAGAVVVRDIPAGEVWGGNPAVKIR